MFELLLLLFPDPRSGAARDMVWVVFTRRVLLVGGKAGWDGLRWYGPSRFGNSLIRTTMKRCAHQTKSEGAELKVTIPSIDLAKSVFHLHGVDARGRTVLRQRVEPCTTAAVRRAVVELRGSDGSPW
jgi:hypothetical protein